MASAAEFEFGAPVSLTKMLPDGGGSPVRRAAGFGMLRAQSSGADVGSRRAQWQSDLTAYDAMVRLFHGIGHYTSISELASVLAAEASPIVRFDCIGISRYDDLKNTVEWHVSIPKQGMESGSSAGTTGHLLTNWAYQQQMPLVIAPLDAETRLRSNILQRLPERIQSVCAVPLTCKQHNLGALFIGSVAEDAYGEEEVRFLSLVATQVSSAIENHLAYAQIAELKDRLKQESFLCEEELCDEHGFKEIVGRSATLRKVLQHIETVAPTDCTVLICGETGTGKELIARAIHDRSARHAASLVKLNCSAIPTGLLESELFGHEKGAFTGAISQRIGRFELANRGTMFLDEIGDIPLELQPKLLRVLQEREFERLGSSRTLHTDTRLIAATNLDLEKMVEEKRFRSDLFYRLNVFPIRIPALRERAEDIPLFVQHFMRHFAKRMNKSIEIVPSETMTALTHYSWPGNIRELENLIERSVILSSGPVLRVPLSDLPNQPINDVKVFTPRTLEEVERAHILATLEQSNWTIAGKDGAAARLGMNRSTMHFRMNKLGIVRPGKQVMHGSFPGRQLCS